MWDELTMKKLMKGLLSDSSSYFANYFNVLLWILTILRFVTVKLIYFALDFDVLLRILKIYGDLLEM